jgi:hypothetical protein
MERQKQRQDTWASYAAPASAAGPAASSPAKASAGSLSKVPAAAPQSPVLVRETIHARANVGNRRRVPWSSQEVNLLRKAVNQHGPKWTTIYLSTNGFNETRTTMDLKDKWRNLCKGEGAGATT